MDAKHEWRTPSAHDIQESLRLAIANLIRDSQVISNGVAEHIQRQLTLPEIPVAERSMLHYNTTMHLVESTDMDELLLNANTLYMRIHTNGLPQEDEGVVQGYHLVRVAYSLLKKLFNQHL